MQNSGLPRCSWVNRKNADYVRYHDEEWGVPLHEDAKLFELLVLETFQAGLSWECVLNKRAAFRQAFDGFDAARVAAYGTVEIDALLQNEGIIRHRKKIEAAIQNAQVFLALQAEYGSFSTYLWGWTEGRVLVEQGQVSSPLSDAISKDLKARGMKFVGTKVIYAYLQAAGLIYAHDPACFLARKLP